MDTADERLPSPKSLVLDLLSAARGSALPVRTLVRAGEALGIPSNGLRVALSRLRAEGKVVSAKRGSYALSADAQRRNEHVAGWAEVASARLPWDGGFVGVVAGAAAIDDLAIRLLGFARLSPELCVRPDNLAGGPEALREQLLGVGMSDSAVSFRLRDLDRDASARADELWDVRAIAAKHRAMSEALRRSLEGIGALSEPRALREMFLLGGAAIRQIVLDPRLPDELASPKPLTDLVHAMQQYDVEGRTRWLRFLELAPETGLAEAPADWARLRDRLPGHAMEQAP